MLLMVKVCKPSSINMFLAAFLLHNDLTVQCSYINALILMEKGDQKSYRVYSRLSEISPSSSRMTSLPQAFLNHRWIQPVFVEIRMEVIRYVKIYNKAQFRILPIESGNEGWNAMMCAERYPSLQSDRLHNFCSCYRAWM